ncbi:MAG: PaaI family thioesterase [Deltaproteobacteria bacterium]|nr:PaaI family thioesterase [Deltaproteobacteria bacterium]
MDYMSLRSSFTDTIPWVKMSDISVDLLEERHVRLSIPVKEKHLNHVGIVYAGTQFMLMEISGAALFVCTYGIEQFVPINKGMSIRYLKPAVDDLICDLSINKEEAMTKIKPIEEKGKGDWVLDMSISDTSGNIVSSSTCNYYIIPIPKDLMPKMA